MADFTSILILSLKDFIEMGKNFAICIGINDYKNLPSLKYAKHDAEAMREFFLREADFDEIYYFSEDAPPIPQDHGPSIDPKPSLTTLRRFLRVRFDESFLSAGDNFWFFFAGHGLRYKDRDYLMPCDADPGDIERTGISIYHITERLRRCGADNVSLFIDACREQGGRNLGGIGKDHPKGVITFFSCSPNESSYEIDELQHGAFTYALLDAFRHKREDCATVGRLNKFLSAHVPVLSEKYKKPIQNPYSIVESTSRSNLFLFPEKATDLDIATLSGDAKDAELEGNFELAENLWRRVLAADQDNQSAWKSLKRIWSKTSHEKAIEPDNEIKVNAVDCANPEIITSSANALVKSSFSFELVKLNAEGHELSRKTNQIECFVERLGSGPDLELVSIPSGIFTIGSPKNESRRTKREDPQHKVTVQPFLMGRYPITQAQWNIVSFLPKVNLDLEANPAQFRGSNLPVECITWHEAIEFCERLSFYAGRKYRLPSEAEWEYACRANTETPFHFGETIRVNEANYHGEYSYARGPIGNYRKSTSPVDRSLCANAFGLSDMHGNVSEWCQDIWHENYDGAPADGKAWVDEGDTDCRVIRGGSWTTDPSVCRSASRQHLEADSRDDATSFRVVLCTS